MAQLTPMTLAQARELGARYGLEVSSVQALRAGSVNSNFRLETSRKSTTRLNKPIMSQSSR